MGVIFGAIESNELRKPEDWAPRGPVPFVLENFGRDREMVKWEKRGTRALSVLWYDKGWDAGNGGSCFSVAAVS